jgi:Carboxypeptidase regulatory-like domain
VSFTRVEVLTSKERLGRPVRTCPRRECPLWTRAASLRSTVPGWRTEAYVSQTGIWTRDGNGIKDSGRLRNMNSSRQQRARWGSTLLAVLAAATAAAQTSGGVIRGTISDPFDALVPGAAITIEKVSTGEKWSLLSSGAGLYNAPNLPVGTYTLTVKALGFSTAERSNINVLVGSERVVNVRLTLEGSAETITVALQAATVDLATSQTGAVNSGEVVRELPLNGRDWTTLAALQPEVSIVRTENAAALSISRGNRGLGTMMAIGGARPQSSYLLDGVNVDDYAGGGPGSVLGVNLGVDAIQEFSVVTRNAPADYGRTSGGVIDAVTRAGSNQIHGSLYEFLRNSAFDARNFFDGASVLPFKRNQFGGSLGGPVKRQRTFFFVDYEGIRQELGVTTVNTVRSPDARIGDLLSGAVTVSPLVAPFLVFLPLPNGPIKGDTGTYTLVTQNKTTENFVTSRLDHRFSDSDEIHGTYLFDNSQTTGPDVFDDVLLGTSSRRETASVEELHIFSPSMVNVARAGFNRNIAEQVQSISAINPLVNDPSYGFLPGRNVGEISIAGITTFPGGPGAEGDYAFHYTSYQIYDDVAITRGSHSLRTGLAVERIQSNALGAGNNNGVVSFGSLPAFLTDQPSSFQATIPGTSVPEGLRQSVVGAYLQDDWRALRNLTSISECGTRWRPCRQKNTTGWGRWSWVRSSLSLDRPTTTIRRCETSPPASVLPGTRSEMLKRLCGQLSANTMSCRSRASFR